MLETKYTNQEIIDRRNRVRSEFLKRSQNIHNGAIEHITPEDLCILFELYDSIFLDNALTNGFNGHFKFSLSKRMTKSAGLTFFPQNVRNSRSGDVVIEIRIGVNFLFQYESLEREKSVSGIQTRDALEALQLVMEHELCHAIEFIYFHRSSCRGERFKTLAGNLFGHTSSYHRLPTNRELASERLDIHVGDGISFTFKGEERIGRIYAINKRATVMVKDARGNYRDGRGVRYTKYYVPLDRIKKL